MAHMKQTVNESKFCDLIEERCGRENFLIEMRMSEQRLLRLLNGEAELRQEEMIRAAKILKLCSSEFTDCFFCK